MRYLPTIIFILVLISTILFYDNMGKIQNNSNGYTGTAELLTNLGYLNGYMLAGPESGVTVIDREKVMDGYNLFCSGHAPKAILMEMDGSILHEWMITVDQVFPDITEPGGLLDRNKRFRKAFLDENGKLITMFEYTGLMKLDKDSNIIWKNNEGQHHDISIDDDGTIYALGWKEHKTASGKTQIQDYILVMDKDGRTIKQINLLQMFESTPFEYLTRDLFEESDPTHTNSIQILDGSNKKEGDAFKRGNLLISVREINTIAIIDLKKQKIVWAIDGLKEGLFRRQHDAKMLENGNILLFNNLKTLNSSSVIEIDPKTKKIVWEYPQEGVELFSPYMGACTRLKNGNTLITESNAGVAFEVGRNLTVVWEYKSPYRVGEKKELVANLMHMERVDRGKINFL